MPHCAGKSKLPAAQVAHLSGVHFLMSRPLGQAEKQYISQGSDELDLCSDELVLCADVMALVLLNLTPLMRNGPSC